MNQLEQGDTYLSEEKFEEAIRSYDLHAKAEGAHLKAFLGKAIALRKLGKYPESHTEFDLGLKFSPGHPDLHSEKGVTYFQQKKIEEAIFHFDQSLKADPTNPYRYSSLAFAQAKAGFMFEAIDNYEKALELDPDDSLTHNNLGLLKENIGYAQNAQVHFQKSDDLIGRKPGELNPEWGNASNTKTEAREDSKFTNEQPKKISPIKNFGLVAKGLFTSSTERKGFSAFLQKLFSRSGDK